MDLLLSSLSFLIVLVLVGIILLALLSPFEALGWWAGWSKRDIELDRSSLPGDGRPSTVDTRPDPGLPARHYVVYLTGILGFSGDLLGGREIRLMEKIAERLAGDEVMIGDVFPYSINNNPLNGERVFRKSWQWLKDRQQDISNPANVYNWLILLRNLFQVAVSADRRYGPLNNAGVARAIIHSLYAHGYSPGSQKPVILIGYSGGGQISVGAARYLQQALAAPIIVIGLGGVMMGDPGISAVTHLYNLRGSTDFFPWIGVLLSPSRWPFLPLSPWNRAKRAGRITEIPAGSMFHFGRTDYFSQHSKMPDGRTHAEFTADLVVQAIQDMSQAISS